jgi:hypothetical protein
VLFHLSEVALGGVRLLSVNCVDKMLTNPTDLGSPFVNVKTRTYLEMRSPDQLRGSKPAPNPLTLTRILIDQRDLMISVYERVGSNYNWPPVPKWIENAELPNRHIHLIMQNENIAGMAKHVIHEDGTVEISVFGLVPDFKGRGYGGEALVKTVERAWELQNTTKVPGYVWLHTASRDDPHAVPNYLARGFKISRVETRDMETDEILSVETPSES